MRQCWLTLHLPLAHCSHNSRFPIMLVRQSAGRWEVTVLWRFISRVSNSGTGREDDKVLSLTYRGLNDSQCISCIIHSDMPCQEQFQSTQNATSVDSGAANRQVEKHRGRWRGWLGERGERGSWVTGASVSGVLLTHLLIAYRYRQNTLRKSTQQDGMFWVFFAGVSWAVFHNSAKQLNKSLFQGGFPLLLALFGSEGTGHTEKGYSEEKTVELQVWMWRTIWSYNSPT